MDPASQFIVPTIIDVPELIVTNEDLDYDDSLMGGAGIGLGGSAGAGANSRNGFWFAKLQFLGSVMSFTLNLGNLWRFPYLCHKHAGGAFLVAYTIVLVLVGLPLVLMELAFGQYANEGPITIWRISPAFEGIGYSMCLVSMTVAIYYQVLNAWLLHYLFASVTFGSLPWATCDNAWNSRNCFLRSADEDDAIAAAAAGSFNGSQLANCSLNQLIAADSILLAPNSNASANPSDCNPFSMANSSSAGAAAAGSFDKILNTTTDVSLPASEYFHNQVLGLTSHLGELGGLNWSLLLNLGLLWLLDFGLLLKQFRPQLASLNQNKWTLAAALAMPYLCLLALLARALSLPGSFDGLSRLFSVDWTRLSDLDIWLDSSTQLLFALSPCWGGLITLANMNKFHTNFHANTMLLVLLNYLTSVLAGLVAFAVLGFVAAYSGIAFARVADSGPGLMYLVLSEALAQMPAASLNSMLFFAVALLVGLQSQLTVIDTVLTTIVDTWPHKLRYRRPLVLICLCALMFALSLTTCLGNGFYVLILFDAFAGTLAGLLIGLLELLALAWVYGMENFVQDIDDMLGFHRSLFPSRAYWSFMWRYLTPSALFALLLFAFLELQPPSYRDHPLPNWTLRLGWLLTLGCVSLVPGLALIRLLLSPAGSLADKLSYLCRPSEDWAPSSYVSGPKLINRHQVLNAVDDDDDDDDGDGDGGGGGDDRAANNCRRADGAAGGCNGAPTIHASAARRREAAGLSAAAAATGAAYSSVRSCDEGEPARRKGRASSSGLGGGGGGGGNDGDNSDDDDGDDDEDLKVVDGRANYIIPEEEEDDTDTGLISTNETNV